MLPYPSGALHMGHVRNYAIGDALARYMWMNDYNVLHPMGWDSFGLPAENAAIQNNTPPRQWTLGNIAKMKAQMKRLGFAYDWSREVTTCLPDYYRWNQWFFLKFYEKGLAYRKKSRVNWCPKCAPFLPTSRSSDGCCWRHEDTLVEQRELEQWFLPHHQIRRRIIARPRQARRLAGKSPHHAAQLDRPQRRHARRFQTRLRGEHGGFGPAGSTITVFTTRVDTIFGATSVQLAPQHPLIADLTASNPDLRAKVDQLIAEQRKAKEVGDIGEIEKHGVFTGRYANNPFNQEKVPIWVANYILMDYGTGAIMSVPAHDERDYEFAKKYKLEIRLVILPLADDPEETMVEPPLPYRCPRWHGRSTPAHTAASTCAEAIKKMSAFAEKNGFGKATVTLSLERLGNLAPALLGHADPHALLRKRWHRSRSGKRFARDLARGCRHATQLGSPLGSVPEFVNATCPKCGGPARRETDTMDTFVDSSWYFYRYTDAHNDRAPFDSKDRAILVSHRPVHRRRRARHPAPDLFALLDEVHARPRPHHKRRARRAPLHPGHGHQRRRQNVEEPGQRRQPRRNGRPLRRRRRAPLQPLRRPARSRPRLAGFRHRRHPAIPRAASTASSMSHADPEARDSGASSTCACPDSASPPIQRKLHQTIKRVTDDFKGRWHFNTCIAAIMELVNEANRRMLGSEDVHNPNRGNSKGENIPPALLAEVQRESGVSYSRPSLPISPTNSGRCSAKKETCSKLPGQNTTPRWPKKKSSKFPCRSMANSAAASPCQPTSTQEFVLDRALADEKVQAFIAGKQIVKKIYVPGKLVNIVVK